MKRTMENQMAADNISLDIECLLWISPVTAEDGGSSKIQESLIIPLWTLFAGIFFCQKKDNLK